VFYVQFAVDRIICKLLFNLQEMENLRAQLAEAGTKIHELIVINQALDATCRQVELAKEHLETRLEAVDGSSDEDTSQKDDAEVDRLYLLLSQLS